jgi:hypothetical protein
MGLDGPGERLLGTAAAHEQAAVSAGEVDTGAHQDAAARHREAAEHHDAAAAEQTKLEMEDIRRLN